MTNKVKEISENQFWQLVGLITASIELDTRRESLHQAWKEIVNEEAVERFWDFGVGCGENLIDELKQKLAYDGVTLKEKS